MSTDRALANEIAVVVAERVSRTLASSTTPVTPEYLTAAQVSQITGFSQKALEAFRSKRTGPPYLKIGKSVRYRTDDIRSWMESEGCTK